MTIYLYLLLAISAEVVGTAALKASNGFTQLFPSIIAVIGYGIAFYFLSLTLRTIPIGIAYGMWSGLGIVLISIVGVLVFDQKLDFWAVTGIGLIMAGVLVINLLSQSTTH